MEKSTLIIGPSGSGKTTKAFEIAKTYPKDEVVILGYHGEEVLNHAFYFSDCTKKTKIIVIDELWDIREIEHFYNYIKFPITVNKKGKKSFKISPKFVITCQSDMKTDQIIEKMGMLIFKRFKIIFCYRYETCEI